MPQSRRSSQRRPTPLETVSSHEELLPQYEPIRGGQSAVNAWRSSLPAAAAVDYNVSPLTQEELSPNNTTATADGYTKAQLNKRISTLNDNVYTLQAQITNLATQLAQRPRQGPMSMAYSFAPSTKMTKEEMQKAAENTFTAALGSDSRLNPLGQKFDYKEWIRNLMAIDTPHGASNHQRNLSVCFHRLGVSGLTPPNDYQKSVYSALLSLGNVFRWATRAQPPKVQIISEFDGLVRKGEMLLVLGRPGSGCTTFLKTISGEMDGLITDKESYLNYQGISSHQMQTQFRGEAIYTAEQDVHFPQLTVAQTLSFAARARVPENRIADVSREQYAEHMKDVVMAIFGLTDCADTKVGNDLIRGVSGGERKRVSIAEATLNGSPVQSWDNSTRGLDASNAINFCKTLRTQSDLFSRSAYVAIYQAPESAYQLFDKVTLLYEGRQIYFGRAQDARRYFTDMGFVCRERETTSDFLTSLTNPKERIIRPGFEHIVPETAQEFVKVWQQSETYKSLVQTIHAYDARYPIGGKAGNQFQELRQAEQAKTQRKQSPYTISVPMQIKLCLDRGFARLRADASLLITSVFVQAVLALIVGSIFYNMQPTTASLFSRSAILFYATLLNALSTHVDVLNIYAQRPIVEKHSRYALYHPFSEAASAVLCDLPGKLALCVVFNLTVYFLTNLRREPGPFFVYMLFAMTTTQTMSMMFRTAASLSKSIAQAMAPTAILTLGMCLYTGFPIPVTSMPGWSRWLNYINPLAYVFEGLMVNELSGRDFDCSTFMPSGPGFQTPGPNSICTTVGSLPGKATVSGDDYLGQSFQYFRSHLWRNYGILLAFLIFFWITHLLAAEYITEEVSKGEVLLFRRPRGKLTSGRKTLEGRMPTSPMTTGFRQSMDSVGKRRFTRIQKHHSIIHWQSVCYDIVVGKEQKRLLDNVDGWIKPGTCTALMGMSGAGKTTLLDVLGSRVRTGVVTGDILVNGIQKDASYQRNCGYVQQSDLHLPSATVKEALRFSAVLRQPSDIPIPRRVAYVDEVLQLLDMELYADAVIGVPGQGLNVEQRKRLTVAVELVAKPQLLVLLDEPTSGLDSQTAWSIMDLLDTLKLHGQAVLCTIHQPSATIFQRFDRLLLLERGKTVYFGDIGRNCATLVNYFQDNGASPCLPRTNPAEWMLEVIRPKAESHHKPKDWSEVWRQSANYRRVQEHLTQLSSRPVDTVAHPLEGSGQHREFAVSFNTQFRECFWRAAAHYWRTPSYIYSKLALPIVSSLLIGFTFFRVANSLQGVQNVVLAVFMLLTMFSGFVSQIIPNFLHQRALFEARECPAKIYSWPAFLLSQMSVEMIWNSVVAVIIFVTWYYPIGLHGYAPTHQAMMERGGLMFLLVWSFMLFASTFAYLCAAGAPQAEIAAPISEMFYSLSLTFSGVLSSPTALPGFWIFLYRVSPFTYLVSGMVSDAIGGVAVQCSDVELLRLPPPDKMNCGQYLDKYLAMTGGALQNPGATSECLVCQTNQTDAVIAQFGIYYQDRWRNFGLMLVYIVFNALMALGLYWLARVPRQQRKKKEAPAPGLKEKGLLSSRPPSRRRPYLHRSLSRRTSIASNTRTEVTGYDDDSLPPLPSMRDYGSKRSSWHDRSLPSTPPRTGNSDSLRLPIQLNAPPRAKKPRSIRSSLPNAPPTFPSPWGSVGHPSAFSNVAPGHIRQSMQW